MNINLFIKLATVEKYENDWKNDKPDVKRT